MPGGQYVNHFNAVRYRITGSGNLLHQLNSLNAVYTAPLPTITMQSTTNRYPNVLVNITQPRVQVELWTDAIDEVFTISQIIVYARPITTGYPQ